MKPTKQDKEWLIQVMDGNERGKVSIHPSLLSMWLDFGWFELDTVYDEDGELIGTDFVTTPKGTRILNKAQSKSKRSSS